MHQGHRWTNPESCCGRRHLTLFWKRRERKSRFHTLVLVFFSSLSQPHWTPLIPFQISAFPYLTCLSSEPLLMPGNRIMLLSSPPSSPWCWERLRAGGEEGDKGWDGWMALPTQWTWVWTNSGRWWRTGKPGVLQSLGSQRVWHNWLNNNAPHRAGLLLSPQPSLPSRLIWILFHEASVTYLNWSLLSPRHLQYKLTTQDIGCCLIVSCCVVRPLKVTLALCTSSVLPMGTYFTYTLLMWLTSLHTCPRPQLVNVLIRCDVQPNV